ncbi:MAG: serine hydrolase domain-containing protein [Bacteroidota bacterium]
MKHPLLLIGLAVVLWSANPADPKYKKATDSARQLIGKQMQQQRIPGVAVAVTVGGKTVWSEGFGYADVEEHVSVNPEQTRFRIASISKALTAAAMAVMREQGQLALDSPVSFYRTDFPFRKYRPTVRQVAGHLGGIRHYRGNENESKVRYNTVTDGLTIFKDDTLICKPGTAYNYSSYGFNLLSAVMETASGKDYLTLMQETVLNPLAMRHTVADRLDSIIVGRGRYYLRNGQYAPYVDNSYKWAGGGYLSTAADLAVFGNGLLTNKLIRKETLQEFIRSQQLPDGTPTGYGMGFSTGKDKSGRIVFGHSGGAVGGTSNLVIYPEQQLVLVILTNVSGADLYDLSDKIAEQFLLTR